MNNTFHIQNYAHIRANEVALNGESLYENTTDDFSEFIKGAYQYLKTDYSKFFKMDNLSKLAFMAADVLLKNEPEKNIGLVLSNKASSLDTDRKHQDSLETYASPAVFVYTLPNICLGEISIKHQLYSENSFFIFDAFNAEALHTYANSLMQEEKAEKMLCGWVDFDKGNYDAFLYVVAKKGTFVHSTTEINRLYQIK